MNKKKTSDSDIPDCYSRAFDTCAPRATEYIERWTHMSIETFSFRSSNGRLSDRIIPSKKPFWSILISISLPKFQMQTFGIRIERYRSVHQCDWIPMCIFGTIERTTTRPGEVHTQTWLTPTSRVCLFEKLNRYSDICLPQNNIKRLCTNDSCQRNSLDNGHPPKIIANELEWKGKIFLFFCSGAIAFISTFFASSPEHTWKLE